MRHVGCPKRCPLAHRSGLEPQYFEADVREGCPEPFVPAQEPGQEAERAIACRKYYQDILPMAAPRQETLFTSPSLRVSFPVPDARRPIVEFAILTDLAPADHKHAPARPHPQETRWRRTVIRRDRIPGPRLYR